MTTKTLSLEKIRLDGSTQPRVELEDFLVAEYKDLYLRGVKLPPLEVMFDGASYWLFDGFHRRWGADQAGLDKLPCRVTNGTREDAQWASYQQNQSHGLRRTNADKENVIKRALRHPKGIEMSDSQLSQLLGVTDKTVAKYRSELESTSEIPKLEKTVGKDGKARKARKPRRKNAPAPVPAPAPAPAIAPVDDEPCSVCQTGMRVDGDRCQRCIDASHYGDDDGVLQFTDDQQPFDLESHSNRVRESLEFFESLFPSEHHGALAEILRHAADEIDRNE